MLDYFFFEYVLIFQNKAQNICDKMIMAPIKKVIAIMKTKSHSFVMCISMTILYLKGIVLTNTNKLYQGGDSL